MGGQKDEKPNEGECGPITAKLRESSRPSPARPPACHLFAIALTRELWLPLCLILYFGPTRSTRCLVKSGASRSARQRSTYLASYALPPPPKPLLMAHSGHHTPSSLHYQADLHQAPPSWPRGAPSNLPPSSSASSSSRPAPAAPISLDRDGIITFQPIHHPLALNNRAPAQIAHSSRPLAFSGSPDPSANASTRSRLSGTSSAIYTISSNHIADADAPHEPRQASAKPQFIFPARSEHTSRLTAYGPSSSSSTLLAAPSPIVSIANTIAEGTSPLIHSSTPMLANPEHTRGLSPSFTSAPVIDLRSSNELPASSPLNPNSGPSRSLYNIPPPQPLVTLQSVLDRSNLDARARQAAQHLFGPAPSASIAHVRTRIPANLLPVLYNELLERLAENAFRDVDEDAVQTLITKTAISEQHDFEDEIGDSHSQYNALLQDCLNIIISDTQHLFKKSQRMRNGQPSQEEKNDARIRNQEVVRRYHTLMENNRALMNNNNTDPENAGRYTWTKGDLAKFKEAFLRFGYGPSANARIAEYIGKGLSANHVQYFKRVLKKRFGVKRIKELIASSAYETLSYNAPDDDGRVLADFIAIAASREALEPSSSSILGSPTLIASELATPRSTTTYPLISAPTIPPSSSTTAVAPPKRRGRPPKQRTFPTPNISLGPFGSAPIPPVSNPTEDVTEQSASLSMYVPPRTAGKTIRANFSETVVSPSTVTGTDSNSQSPSMSTSSQFSRTFISGSGVSTLGNQEEDFRAVNAHHSPLQAVYPQGSSTSLHHSILNMQQSTPHQASQQQQTSNTLFQTSASSPVSTASTLSPSPLATTSQRDPSSGKRPSSTIIDSDSARKKKSLNSIESSSPGWPQQNWQSGAPPNSAPYNQNASTAMQGAPAMPSGVTNADVSTAGLLELLPPHMTLERGQNSQDNAKTMAWIVHRMSELSSMVQQLTSTGQNASAALSADPSPSWGSPSDQSLASELSPSFSNRNAERAPYQSAKGHANISGQSPAFHAVPAPIPPQPVSLLATMQNGNSGKPSSLPPSQAKNPTMFGTQHQTASKATPPHVSYPNSHSSHSQLQQQLNASPLQSRDATPAAWGQAHDFHHAATMAQSPPSTSSKSNSPQMQHSPSSSTIASSSSPYALPVQGKTPRQISQQQNSAAAPRWSAPQPPVPQNNVPMNLIHATMPQHTTSAPHISQQTRNINSSQINPITGQMMSQSPLLQLQQQPSAAHSGHQTIQVRQYAPVSLYGMGNGQNQNGDAFAPHVSPRTSVPLQYPLRPILDSNVVNGHVDNQPQR